MAKVAPDANANSTSASESPAYAPSWIDHLTAGVARLPGPSWSYYLGLGLFLFALQTAVLWAEGALPISSTVHRVHGFLAAAIALFLLLFHYLDQRASGALKVLRPTLKVCDKEYAELHHRFTTLPMRLTLLASLVALTFMALIETIGEHYHLDPLNSFPISGHTLRFLYWVAWWLFGAFLYHTVRQLRLIDRIYTERTHINLFRMKPLWALSNLTALTAGSLTMIPYGFVLVNPRIDWTEDPVVLGFYLVITFFAAATFIWPQLGIHRLQVAEKERLLDEANQRFETTILEMHQRIDSGQLEKITDLNMVLASLEIEKSALRRIATWPWEPEVVRLLVTALAMPLGLWLIQVILQRTLGS
jgi:hypothetical protein